VSEDVARTFYY